MCRYEYDPIRTFDPAAPRRRYNMACYVCAHNTFCDMIIVVLRTKICNSPCFKRNYSTLIQSVLRILTDSSFVAASSRFTQLILIAAILCEALFRSIDRSIGWSSSASMSGLVFFLWSLYGWLCSLAARFNCGFARNNSIKCVQPLRLNSTFKIYAFSVRHTNPIPSDGQPYLCDAIWFLMASWVDGESVGFGADRYWLLWWWPVRRSQARWW